MKSGSVKYGNSVFHYLCLGSGSNVIVCFPGFGETAQTFALLENLIGEHHSLFVIDLPFHGNSEWNEDRDFFPGDLVSVIDLIPEINQGKITLSGYSMGGRVILSLFELIPERINKLILLAPDGLIVNPWYRLATRTKWGNRIFLRTMQDPRWFMKLAMVLQRLGFVNKSVYRFATEYLKQPEARMALYQIWTLMRKFKPDLSNIKREVKKNKCRILLVFGKHDRIITPGLAQNLVNGIEEFCQVQILNSGHNILNERNASELISIFNK